MIYVIIIFCIIETIFASMQKLEIISTTIHKGDLWAKGFLLNPNFLGTLLLIGLSYSLGFYIESNELEKIIFYLIITFILFVGLLLTNTLSCIIGLVFVMIVLFIYSIKYKYIKKYIILCVVLLFTLIFVHLLGMTRILNDIIKTKNETTNIVKGDFNNEYGTGRVELWKKTIPIIPKYLLHGVVVDCFSNVFDGKPIWRIKDDGYRVFYDKAHNEYLQILVTMGIFSLISYLCMHFLIIKNGTKNTFKNKEIYYLLPVIGYIIQAQFNISVIEVAPIFYIALGLLVNRDVYK